MPSPQAAPEPIHARHAAHESRCLLISRCSHARAYDHSSFTVVSESPIAAAVSSWLLARGFAAGAELAHLHPDNDGAARVYARLGFVETAGFDVYILRAPSTNAADTG